jgi:hypothetical protein
MNEQTRLTLIIDANYTGVKNTTSKFFSFKGVRYGDAPTGNNRWRAPISPPSKNYGEVDAKNVRKLLNLVIIYIMLITHLVPC